MRACLALLLLPLAAQAAGDSDPLAGLTKGHPRLIATPAAVGAAKARRARDPEFDRLVAQVLAKAERQLGEPVTEHAIPDGKRLLAASRRVLDRTETLGAAWLMTGDARFAERAWRELDAAAGWKDWNPSHFLDTAELCRAFGLGLDWLHAPLGEQRRARLRGALVEKGLRPALLCHQGKGQSGFPKVTHNWNQVCNGGVGIGALAVADEEPALARELLARTLPSLRRSLDRFGPDGGWDEGYGYFHYAANYTVAFLAALETATGTTHGLERMPGMDRAADYPPLMEGPSGHIFPYADCGERSVSMPEIGWLAGRHGRSLGLAWQRRKGLASPSALDILWLPEAPAVAAKPPLASRFAANAVGLLRTGFGAGDAFVGLKAGDNRANHAHLDIGSFVYESGGNRWAVDLGGDDYNLPGYFGKARWTYYRLRAEGHNTLALRGAAQADQDPRADCPLVLCEERDRASLAVADLTAALTGTASARRGFRLSADRALRIQDEVRAGPSPAALLWSLHTRATAEVTADGRAATLTLPAPKGSRLRPVLRVELRGDPAARLESLPAGPLPPASPKAGERDNGSHRKLAVRWDVPAGATRTLVVDLRPEGAAPPDEVRPLETWKAR